MAVIPTTGVNALPLILCKARVSQEVDAADIDRYRIQYQVGAKGSQYVSLAVNIKVMDDATALLDSIESICAGT